MRAKWATWSFQNLIRSDADCIVSNYAGHFWRSLWRDLRASPKREFVVLPRCLWAFRARREKFFKFSWSNSTMSDSTIDPRNLTSACATIFSSVDKTVPSGVPSFISSKNFGSCKNSYWLQRKLQRIKIRLQKRGGFEWISYLFWIILRMLSKRLK